MPVSPHEAFPRRPPSQCVARLQLSHVLEWGRWGGDVPQLHEHVQRFPVECARGQARCVEGLQLGSERDAPRRRDHVQRFDAEAVARQQQRPLRGIPDGEREHSSELGDALRSELLVEVEHRLCIALGTEDVAARDEAAPQFAIVVDLAIEDDDLRAVLVEYRLLPAAQVDDAQSPHPQADRALHVEALFVRAAVLERGAQALQQRAGDRMVGISMDDAGDAAHGFPLAQE